MPIVEVTAFEERFQDTNQNRELIKALTDAMTNVFGDDVKADTWIVLHGEPKTRWGFGGTVR